MSRTPRQSYPFSVCYFPMPLTKISLWGYRCLRCEHLWVPRSGMVQPEEGKKPVEPPEEPRVCPKCKSPYWNRARKGEK